MYISLTANQVSGLLEQPTNAVLKIEKAKIKGDVGASPVRDELIWVREPFRRFDRSVECGCSESPCGCPATGTVLFKASHYVDEVKWKSPVCLPKRDSRLTLKVKSIDGEAVNVEVFLKNIFTFD